MINETIVNRLEELIKERIAGLIFTEADAGWLAEYLAESGVIAAPVKIGQVVYAGLSKVFFDDEEDEIFPWVVKGIGIDEHGRYIAINSFGEQYIVDSENCRLTKEAAEEDLARFNAEYNKSL